MMTRLFQLTRLNRCLLVVALLLGGVSVLHPEAAPARLAEVQPSVDVLPLPVQYAFSVDVGRDDATYHLASDAVGGYAAANSRTGLAATFSSSGLQVRAGSDTWSIGLSGWGRRADPRSVPTVDSEVVPTAARESANLSPGATGVITGTVTNANGNPVAGIEVAAGDYDSMLGCGGAGHWTSTDANGTYHLDVNPGTYLVSVYSHGQPGHYIPEVYLNVNTWSEIGTATPVTVTDGQTVTNVDFSLPFGFTVSGRLVDDQGQPVLSAGGSIRDYVRNIEFGCALGFGSSDTDGTFQINVPAGKYDLGFGKDADCFTVKKNLVITDHVALGDILFAEAPEPPPFDPYALEPGYTVETVVPGSPNCTSDVAIISDTIFLAAFGSTNVYEVRAGGTLTSTAAVGVYALDAGPDGNLYGYSFPDDGVVYRITPGGEVATVGNLPETACGSTLTVAPDGDIWIGYNYCGGTGFGNGTLYRITPGGQVFTVTTDLPFGIGGLDFDGSGQLYMTLGNQLFHVDTSDGRRTLLATLSECASSHGLVAAPDGNMYVSSRGAGNDHIFKVTSAGSVSTFAALPAGCVTGLDRMPDGDLIATMPCTGALYRVHPDGAWETLLPGNGMATPQAMAFSLAGELLVVNDESGAIVRIKNGHGELFARVISFITPWGHLAFEPSGSFYFSEAAPGFQPRLVKVSPQGEVSEVTSDLSFPSGLAFTPDGTLYVAEYQSGEVSSVSLDGTVTRFVDGLTQPQAMAADETGNLYVANGCDRLWKIDPAGNTTVLANIRVDDLAFSPVGELYVTGPLGRRSGVLRMAPDGSVTPFAAGFLNAAGLAFDLAGDLYISDDRDNSITRITGFPRGAIEGTVTDVRSSEPISGARLSVITGYPVVLGAEFVVDGDGSYSARAAPRTYTVIASAPGYGSASQRVTVSTGITLTVNFALEPLSRTYLPLVLMDN